MNSSKFLFSISVVVALATTASDAQIILRIDFSERGADPASTTQSGFDPFVIDSVGSVSLAQTNSTSRTIGSLTVTLSGNGSNPGYDDQLRSTPLNSGLFTESLLLRDLVFSPSTSSDAGLNVAIDGLTQGSSTKPPSGHSTLAAPTLPASRIGMPMAALCVTTISSMEQIFRQPTKGSGSAFKLPQTVRDDF